MKYLYKQPKNYIKGDYIRIHGFMRSFKLNIINYKNSYRKILIIEGNLNVLFKDKKHFCVTGYNNSK